jgi:hypothetical protein
VHLTPPGSQCSILFGTGVTTAAPGSVQGLHLIVSDIVAAHAELTDRGVPMGEIFHDAGGVSTAARKRGGSAARTRSAPATARSPPSATRTATGGCCRR